MRTLDPTVLLVEGSDFDTFPAGGQLTMARTLMKLFGDRLALVGMTSGDEPVGCWATKEIAGNTYWFFPACRRESSSRKPLVPARLEFFRGLKRHRDEIMALGCRSAFLQAPEALVAVSPWNWESLCFWFAGVENPLKVSRYWFAAPLRRWFDRAVFTALKRVDVILAAADESAIGALVSRSRGRLARERINQLPTCVDTNEFRPGSVAQAREELGIPLDGRIFVNSGRIGRFKGWELLVSAFEEFLCGGEDAFLYFVGDGEDRPLLETRIRERNLESRIKITGFQKPEKVISYLRAADLAVFGSFVEGWSVAMLEALACGKPIVTTEVSGADSMVIPGENGFIVNNREAAKFAQAMRKALQLPEAGASSRKIAARFDLSQLGQRVSRLWPPMGQEESTVAAVR